MHGVPYVVVVVVVVAVVVVCVVCVVDVGGGVGKNDELAVIGLCALSYTAQNGMCSQNVVGYT